MSKYINMGCDHARSLDRVLLSQSTTQIASYCTDSPIFDDNFTPQPFRRIRNLVHNSPFFLQHQ